MKVANGNQHRRYYVLESRPILLYKTQLKTSKNNLLFQLKSLVQSFGIEIFQDLS